MLELNPGPALELELELAKEVALDPDLDAEATSRPVLKPETISSSAYRGSNSSPRFKTSNNHTHTCWPSS